MLGFRFDVGQRHLEAVYQWTTMDINGQQWTTNDNNGQQWTTIRRCSINQSMFITLATTHRIFQASKAKNRATVLITKTKTELGTILTTEGP